jgi:hypothetical protein
MRRNKDEADEDHCFSSQRNIMTIQKYKYAATNNNNGNKNYYIIRMHNK